MNNTIELREEFENWLRSKYPSAGVALTYRRDMKGSDRFDEYISASVQQSWLAWQAASATAPFPVKDSQGNILCKTSTPETAAWIIQRLGTALKLERAVETGALCAPKH